MDGKHYRDQVDITMEEFWPNFFNLKEQPSTTACNPGDFLTIFSELAKTTNNIVCILLTRVLSATQESAYQAKRMVRQQFPDLNIEIVDSKSCAGALGFTVLEASRAAKAGKSLAEVADVARQMVSRVYYIAALDTLKYLIGIGRAPRGSNLAEVIHVKPIVGFVDDTGLLDVVARVRGSYQSMTKLVDLVKKYDESDRPLHAMVHYTDGIKAAEELKQMLVSRYKCAEVFITRYTPVMLTATGPTLGLSFYHE